MGKPTNKINDAKIKSQHVGQKEIESNLHIFGWHHSVKI